MFIRKMPGPVQFQFVCVKRVLTHEFVALSLPRPETPAQGTGTMHGAHTALRCVSSPYNGGGHTTGCLSERGRCVRSLVSCG